MTRRGRAGILAAALTLSACAEPPEVALCVRTAPDDQPFAIEGATELSLRATPLEGPEIEQPFDDEARTLRLPTLDFGTWSFTLEANLGSSVLATGRTRFFEITTADDPVPCLYFASVGTFGDTPAPPPADDIHLVFSALDGATALLATDRGFVVYDHETGTFAPDLLPLPPVSSTEGAVWTSLPGGRAALITTTAEGAIIGPDGTWSAVVSLQDPGPLAGAASVAAGVTGTSVLLIGGAADAATAPTPDRAVRRVDLADGTVTFLSAPAELAVRDTRVEPLGGNTFLVAGGNAGSADVPESSPLVAVIDPLDGVIGTASLDLPRRDAAVAVADGNLLVFGGRGSANELLDSIERLQIFGDQPVHRDAPLGLTAPRAGALALVAGGGVLVVGGETGSSAGDATADRYTFERDDAVAANAPGVALSSPAATFLHDGAVLVVSPGAAVVYRP